MPSRRLRRRFSSASISQDRGAGHPTSVAIPRGRRDRRNTSSSTATGFYFNGSDREACQRSNGSSNSRDHSPPTGPLIYASLPPTPVSPSASPTSPTFPQPLDIPFSLWDYLREELLATDFDSHQELKWERVSNFLHIPLAMEKACAFDISIASLFDTCCN